MTFTARGVNVPCSQELDSVAGVPGSLVGGVVVDRSKGSGLPAVEEPSATFRSLRDPMSSLATLVVHPLVEDTCDDLWPPA